jgi:carbamoyltransferase
MLICGLKLTHDGTVAVIDDGRLLFSVEMEKLNNSPRYAALNDAEEINGILDSFGVSADDIDHYVVDGWGGYDSAMMDPQSDLQVGSEHNMLKFGQGASVRSLGVRQYIERNRQDDILRESAFSGLIVGGKERDYTSFLHVTGHVMGAYATSPFAAAGESAFVLVWDGGMYPHLYYFDTEKNSVGNLGPLFLLIGNIYTVFSQHFGPFDIRRRAYDDLSIAGKVMAYTALGEVRSDVFKILDELTAKPYTDPMGFGNAVAAGVKEQQSTLGLRDEDVLATFQSYLERRLIAGLANKIARLPHHTPNLCFAGGCALNVIWNRAVRAAGVFKDVFVPPFPNDSGSAIGQACAKQFCATGRAPIQWSVYSGPMIQESQIPKGWSERPCSIRELAQLLYTTGEPCVVVRERAEIGPRALGNRSILASAQSIKMKDLLNAIKKREPYRPVAPMCIEEEAPRFFDPGTPDPYMVFNHEIRPAWRDQLAAVMHLDGSARLQTVSSRDNPVIYEILREFGLLSGVPVLCNTSANLKGCGFFPDIRSAMEWGGVNYVWSDGKLFEHFVSSIKEGAV